MNCPKCSVPMSAIREQNVEVDRCTGCGGLWFDTFEHEQLRELGGAEGIDSAARQSAATPPTLEVRPCCPRCSIPLFHMVVAGQPHIAYESCGLCHGVYLDAGEFRDFCEETLQEKLREQWSRLRAFVTAA